MLTTDHQIALCLGHVRQSLGRRLVGMTSGAAWRAFDTRLERHFPVLLRELASLYAHRTDFLDFLEALMFTAWQGWSERPLDLRELDRRRESEPRWFETERMVGGVCYVDLFCGDLRGVKAQIPFFKELGLTYLHLMPPFLCPAQNSDGGYAVTSYRDVNPALGNIEDLKDLAAALRDNGISLVLDFIFNHTSDEHAWARGAVMGDEAFRDFYFLFPDRQMPDAYDRTVREIFPHEHPGAFSQLPDGRWVWTTFHSFQWDLNYRNPAVFNAIAGEMLAIANLGAEILRMDAVPFIWKQLGSTCENLPQAHTVIRAFNALARIAAPGLLFKSEAIVHPDDVIKYISPQECQLSYNALQMALLWNSLATREVNLLHQALEERHHLPPGTSWVNFVRSHDDIGWTFSDEDAMRLGINGFDHRQFLNRFYVNRFTDSFARGAPFQDNPATGDCRICGTCASLAGVEHGDPHGPARVLLLYSVALSSGGIPLIYLGDEVGTLNDPGYLDDPAKAGDSRWIHRPRRDRARYAQRLDLSTQAGQIFGGLRRMIEVRVACPAFGGGTLTGFRTGNPSVLGYTRQGGTTRVLALANFSEVAQPVRGEVFGALPAAADDLLNGLRLELHAGLTLGPYQVVWLDLK